MKYKVIDLMPKGNECSFAGPYCMAFCFPISGPVIVKGHRLAVIEYVNRNMTICHFNIAEYNSKNKRKPMNNCWNVNRKGFTIKVEKPTQRVTLFKLVHVHDLICTFNSIPHKFIRELGLYDKASIIYELAKEVNETNK